MTGPDEPAPATEAEGLVDAYVKAIVDGAHVPHGAREDLTEELFGHIAERIRAHAASGLSVAAATQRAIDDFGGAEELAGAFGRTFHSALWASTIGVLLAGVAIDGPRPGAIRWLRLMMAIAALFMAGGAIVFGATATPVVAVSSVVAYLYAFGACALAYRALGTGQRWSLWYAIAVAIDFIVSGVWMVANPATPGAFTVPLGTLLGAGVLLAVSGQWARLRAYTAGSGRIGAGLTAALVSSLILPLLVGPVFAVVPDPTQARAADVDVRWTMTCDRGDVDAGGTVTHDRQRLHLVLEAAWRRADLLPFGLMNRENPPVGGDSAGYQVQPASELSGESWFLVTNEDPVDTLDGAVVGWYGATAPSEGLLPPGIIGGYTVAIEPSAIRDGHTIRASWLMAPSDPQDAEWPRIRGAYAHLDRFLLVATVGCGESAQAVEVPIWARLAR